MSESENTQNVINDSIIVVLTLISVFLLIVVIIVVYFLWRKGYIGKTVVVDVQEGNVQRFDMAELTGIHLTGSGDQGNIHNSAFRVDWEDLEIHNLIGRGTFGEVYSGFFRGTKVAIKKLANQSVEGETINEFEKEFQILSELRHPNIVLFMAACMTLPNISIVLEFCTQGSLRRVLDDESITLAYNQKVRMASDIARGMSYLHFHKPPILHRDLKSPNLLVTENLTVKVSDFGLTTIMEEAKFGVKRTAAAQETRGSSFVGSVTWAAPEIMNGQPYTVKCDVYSYGIVLFEIISRTPPYEGLHPLAVGYQVMKNGLRPEACGPKEIAEMMTICWDKDENVRPSFSDLCEELDSILVAINPINSGELFSQSMCLPSQDYLNNISKENIPEPGMNVMVTHIIYGSSYLWRTWPGTMKRAVKKHNWEIRKLIRQHHGYENSMKIGSFVIIFESMDDAILFCNDVQLILMGIPWGEEVTAMTNCHREEDKEGNLLYTGLRTCQSVHIGMLDCDTDLNTLRKVFYGKSLEVSLHIAHIAQPGQTIFHGELLRDVKQVEDSHSFQFQVRAAGRAVFLNGEVDIYEVVARKLAQRNFYRLKNINANNVNTNDDSLSPWLINPKDLLLSREPTEKSLLEGSWGDCRVYCKILTKNAPERDVLDWHAELRMQAQIRHPNINSFLGVCFEPDLFFISEFQARGTLESFLETQGGQILSLNRRIKMLMDVTRGLSYLHSFNPAILHLNLSTATLLVSENLQIKISDFGFASHKTLDIGVRVTDCYMQSFHLRTYIVSPEILRNELATEKSDIYSFAMVMYEILVGRPPFNDVCTTMDLVVQIIAGLRPSIPNDMENHFVELLENSWAPLPDDRPASSEILQKLINLPRPEVAITM